MTSLKIVFSEQYYFPEGWGGAQIPRDLTVHLARSGHDVAVICGADQYSNAGADAVEDPRASGITIKRIPRAVPGTAKQWRVLRQAWFYLGAIVHLLLIKRPSLFITQTNPPFIVMLVCLASKIRKIPYIIVCQDLYPEVLFAHRVLRPESGIGSLLSRIFRWSYKNAHRVVSLGTTMSERLEEKGVVPERIEVISNWATGKSDVIQRSENSLVRKWSLADAFVVLYSGNMGVSHDVTTPIGALAQARQSIPNVRMVFIGAGSRLSEAKDTATTLGIEESVDFHDWVPMELLPHSLGLAHIALVTLQPDFGGLVVPSKALGYLARGIPIIYIGPESDIQEIVRKSGAGLTFPNGDLEGVADAIVSLSRDHDLREAYGLRGKHYYDQRLDRALGLKSYSRLLDTLNSN